MFWGEIEIFEKQNVEQNKRFDRKFKFKNQRGHPTSVCII